MAVRSQRRAGVLLHLSALPGPGLGQDGHRFVRFLHDAGFGVWQILPTGPVDESLSPYTSASAFAGNPALVDWGAIVSDGGSADSARAFAHWRDTAAAHERHAFDAFVTDNRDWLEEYALFAALHDEQECPWYEWPAPLRRREAGALARSRRRLHAAIEQKTFEQYAFSSQWHVLRTHAHEAGILLFGDVPFFVAHDSVDVWARQSQFKLDENGMPTVVAGVPPDYFSESGQLWGNPVYDWARMKLDRFAWWGRRVAHVLEQLDVVRIDHFRALDAYWEIPAAAQSAREGQWMATPGSELLEGWIAAHGDDRLIAEDLGHITEGVAALRDAFGLRGMRVLQFGFDGDPDNTHLLHNHVPHAVVFTGTHDNDTTLGWYTSLAEDDRRRVQEYLGSPSEPMPWPMVRAAMRSVAGLAVVPMQDLLALGSEARMNVPGVADGNWRWRLRWDEVPVELAPRMREMLRIYGRN